MENTGTELVKTPPSMAERREDFQRQLSILIVETERDLERGGSIVTRYELVRLLGLFADILELIPNPSPDP